MMNDELSQWACLSDVICLSMEGEENSTIVLLVCVLMMKDELSEWVCLSDVICLSMS